VALFCAVGMVCARRLTTRPVALHAIGERECRFMTAMSSRSPSPQPFKSCPRCLLIAHREAFHCQKCGYEFHSSLTADASSPALSENQFNRTHMFSIPPFVPKPSSEAAIAAANWQAKQQFHVLARQQARRRARRLRAYLLFGLLTLTLGILWWLTTGPRF
jgi:hypothetical protein